VCWKGTTVSASFFTVGVRILTPPPVLWVLCCTVPVVRHAAFDDVVVAGCFIVFVAADKNLSGRRERDVKGKSQLKLWTVT
jgi:hypothetical protein